MIRYIRFISILAIGIIITISSCSDDNSTSSGSLADFTVKIENVFEGKNYFSSGTTGFIEPGNSESFSFNAGKGHFLSFATMFVQSNDLFYGAAESGIELYDNSGNPLTGDITSMIELWDAGTEVNEEPGSGANQAPRQSGANTGTTENGSVQLIPNVADGFTYPTVSSVVKVNLTHDGGTLFTVTIENISNSALLATPFAPGVWLIHSSGQMPIFSEGSASTQGLEMLAEDGDNSTLNSNLSAMSGLVSPFAPGAYSVGSSNEVFTSGMAASAALESLAEDGDPSGFTNVFNTPDGVSGAAPILPGESYSFTFSADEGDYLSLATMLVQSNDWVAGIDNIALYSGGTALSGDITSMVKLYDAGTEVDEYAGVGNSQPPRQSGANSGTDENGVVVEETTAGSHVPSVSDFIKVTISNN